MGLMDAYQESTDTALNVMAARPPEPDKPAPKHSAWTTIPRAVAGAFAEAGGNILDVAGAYGQVAAATGVNANPMVPDSPEDRKQRLEAYDRLKTNGIDWRTEEGRVQYDFARDLRPDPITAGWAENAVFGLTRGLTKAIGAGMVLGPVAGAGAFGASEGMTTADDLAEQGVDQTTRAKVGAVTGVISAAGMAVPIAGKTLAGTAGLVVTAGPGSYMVQQQITRSILENADYHELAKQYDPLDPAGLFLATAMPAGFAAWAKAGQIRAAFTPAAKKGARAGTEPTPTAKASQEDIDAAMVHNLTIARDAHEATPPEMLAMKRAPDLSPAHRAIESTAYEQVLSDPKKFVSDYFERFGKVIDSDNVKAMFPAFEGNKALAAAMHEPSSYASKLIFTEALRQNEGAPVVFTAGGGGSGKSESMPIALASAGLKEGGLVFDSTLSSFDSARAKIDQALESGAPVRIIYTNSHIDKAAAFALSRDRVVRAQTLADAHVGASNTIRQLAEHYQGNPLVSLHVVNNSGGKSGMRLGNLDDIFKYDQNDVERRLYELADKSLKSGAITAEKHAAFLAGARRGESQGRNREVQPGQQGQDFVRPGERAGSSAESQGRPAGSEQVSQAGTSGAAPAPHKDPYISTVLSRAEELKARAPDMPIAIREDGAQVKLSDELEAIRREAQMGTEDTFGAQDAPLLKVAVECLLSMGATG